MFNESIIFRQAVENDSEEIWYLLHADSKMISAPKILELIEQLYVLEYQKRILGVLCGTYFKYQVNIPWVAIHPLYPEDSLREAMIQQFSSIFCHYPGNGIKKSSISFLRKLWILSGKLFLKTEGVIDGISDQ